MAALTIDLGHQMWKLDGLCAEIDPELFFPDKGASTREARGVCAKCPVREACLKEAVEDGVLFGVWGGVAGKNLRRLQQEYRASLEPAGEECA